MSPSDVSNTKKTNVSKPTRASTDTGRLNVPRTGRKPKYRSIPDKSISLTDGEHAVWRIELEVLTGDSVARLGLDLNGDVVLGRGRGRSDILDLSDFGAEELGVSRRHAQLHPTETDLFILDLRSTNGTSKNGRPIGVNTPFAISSGDILRLGNLQLAINIIKAPGGKDVAPIDTTEVVNALTTLAKAITSRLKTHEVLERVLEMATSLTEAREVAIWLVDQQAGELFLEAELGIEDEQVKHMRLPVTPDSLAGQVVSSGKPLRTSRSVEGERIKIKTDYVVEAVLYAPLALGNITTGVLAAVHREPGMEFSPQDEQILTMIGNLAAIAVQNSRLFEATDEVLAKRVSEHAAMNEIASAVSVALDLGTVYDVLKEQLQKQWEFQSIGLWLVNDDRTMLEPFPKPTFHEAVKMGEGFVGKVAQSGEAALGKELQESPSNKDHDVETTMKFVSRSTMSVPLTSGGQVIGVLVLFSDHPDAFEASDLELLQFLGRPVAAAIHNSRLFKRLEQQWATIKATVNMLQHPIMIVDQQAKLVLHNRAADELLSNVGDQKQDGASAARGEGPLVQLLEGLYTSTWRTKEITVGDRAFVATVEHSSLVGTIIVMQEITEVTRLENLRAEFAESVAHDIRGPMSSILGYVQMMRSHEFGRDKTQEYLDEILQATSRVSSMVNELLDFAMLTETPRVNLEPADLQKAVKTAVADLMGAALAKSVTVALEITGKAYRVNGDETRLYHSVLNLVDNAIKHAPEDSEVSVELAYSKEAVTIRVQNAGKHIPEEDLPRIFNRFFRSKQASGKTEGFGIGLATIKAIIGAHGGEVTARNVKSGGTEFVITLPGKLRVP